MEYIKAEKTEYPICPFCEQELREVKFKDLRGKDPTGTGSFFMRTKIIFFCPHCKKVLGNADAGTG